ARRRRMPACISCTGHASVFRETVLNGRGLALRVRTTSGCERAIRVSKLSWAPSNRAQVNISEYALYSSAVGTGCAPSGPRECHSQVRSMSDALRKLACFLLFFTIGVGSVDSLAQSRATDQNYYAPVDAGIIRSAEYNHLGQAMSK